MSSLTNREPNKTSLQSGEGKGAGTLKAPPYIGFASDPSLLTPEHGEHGGQSQLAMHSHACRDSENHVHVRRQATPFALYL
jgi:hypothetical protein